MDFVKYSSIENTYQKSQIEQIYLHGYQNEMYTVQEKVHGANFSFWVSGDEIRGAKRSSFLPEDENFYQWQRVREELRKTFDDIRYYLKTSYCPQRMNEEFEYFTIFGELCGGFYKHDEVKNNSDKQIQKGIFYSPDIRFIAFDMFVNGKLMNTDHFYQLCDLTPGLDRVPELFRGSFKECLEYPNEFESGIHKVFGLPVPQVESNVCEGVVIKTVNPLYFKNGSRVIFKNKNQKWSEKSKLKKHDKKIKELNIPPVFSEKVYELINENRAAAVLSKIGEPSMKLMGPALKAFNLDVIEECEKLGCFNGLEKEQIKALHKAISQEGQKVMKKYIIDNHV